MFHHQLIQESLDVQRILSRICFAVICTFLKFASNSPLYKTPGSIYGTPPVCFYPLPPNIINSWRHPWYDSYQTLDRTWLKHSVLRAGCVCMLTYTIALWSVCVLGSPFINKKVVFHKVPLRGWVTHVKLSYSFSRSSTDSISLCAPSASHSY